MAARLGNVLYWLGCAGAVIGLALAAIVFFNPGEYAAIGWPRYLGAGLVYLPAMLLFGFGLVAAGRRRGPDQQNVTAFGSDERRVA